MLAVWLPCAYGAHPLDTEDTGTQGAGNVELENGYSLARSNGNRSAAYALQVSYGYAATLDLLLQPSWVQSRPDPGSAVGGWGDTQLDFKWRFFGRAPCSLGLRAGVTLATARSTLGLAHGTAAAHATLVGTLDAEPFTVHANLGVDRNPGTEGLRRHVGRVRAAVQWAASETFTLSAEAGAASNDDPVRSAWQGDWLAGAVFTLRPGLDVDVGRRWSVRAEPVTRTWLVGLTWRFGL